MTLRSRFRASSSRGATLVDILMALGVAAAASIGGWWLYQNTGVRAEVKVEQEHVTELFTAADRAFGTVGSFERASIANGIAEGWIPRAMIQGNQARNIWGGAVDVRPETVFGRTNAGLLLEHDAVPSAACSQLATSIATSLLDMRVNGVTVLGANAEPDPALVASRCAVADTVTMEFLFYQGAMGTLAEATPLTLPCPTAQQRRGECPPGEFGYRTEQRDPVCDAQNVWIDQEWGAWVEIQNLCDPNEDCEVRGTCPPLPDPEDQPCVLPTPNPEQQTWTCPVTGDTGSIQVQRTATCPQPTGNFLWGGWVVLSNTCAPAPTCPAPQTRAATCPAGQTGSRTEQRDCITMNPNPVWSAWYDIANSCGQTVTPPADPDDPDLVPCELPNPSTETRTQGCPAPQLGEQTEQRNAYCTAAYNVLPQWTDWYGVSDPAPTCYTCPDPETDTDTVSGCAAGQFGNYSSSQPLCRTPTCPAEGAPAGGFGDDANWTAWTDCGPPVTSGLCTPCPAPFVTTVLSWLPMEIECPDGEVGEYKWEKQQSATCTRSYACPAGTVTLPAFTVTCDDPVDTGATRNYVNTCAAECVAPPPATANVQENRTTACPGGQIAERRDGTQTTTWSCPSTFGVPVSTVAPATWGSWYVTSNTCTACGPAPDNNTRNVNCPAGNYGTITESHGWTAAASPTCWTAGAWATINNTCTACPVPSTVTEEQWVPRSQPCPVNEGGVNTWEQRQTRTRSVTYSCPAGTSTLPAPTYGSWSAWSDATPVDLVPTNRRNVVNTCGTASALCAPGLYSTGFHWNLETFQEQGPEGHCHPDSPITIGYANDPGHPPHDQLCTDSMAAWHAADIFNAPNTWGCTAHHVTGYRAWLCRAACSPIPPPPPPAPEEGTWTLVDHGGGQLSGVPSGCNTTPLVPPAGTCLKGETAQADWYCYPGAGVWIVTMNHWKCM